jgi:hypothetical protein
MSQKREHHTVRHARRKSMTERHWGLTMQGAGNGMEGRTAIGVRAIRARAGSTPGWCPPFWGFFVQRVAGPPRGLPHFSQAFFSLAFASLLRKDAVWLTWRQSRSHVHVPVLGSKQPGSQHFRFFGISAACVERLLIRRASFRLRDKDLLHRLEASMHRRPGRTFLSLHEFADLVDRPQPSATLRRRVVSASAAG